MGAKPRKQTQNTTDDAAINRRLRLKVKCGACAYLDRKNPKFSAPCADLGKTASSICCDSYVPAYSRLTEDEPQQVIDLCRELRHLPAHTRHILAYSLVNEDELRRVTDRARGVPMHIGYPIAVRILADASDDCVAIWQRGFLLGISRDGKSIHVGARAKAHQIFPKKDLRKLLGRKKRAAAKGLHGTPKEAYWWVHYSLPVESKAWLTRAEFIKHKKRLIKRGRLNPTDPSILQGFFWKPITEEQALADDYTPPSLADASREWITAHASDAAAALEDAVDAPSTAQPKKRRHYSKVADGVYQIG